MGNSPLPLPSFAPLVTTTANSLCFYPPFLLVHLPDVCCYLSPFSRSGPAFETIRWFVWMWFVCVWAILPFPSCLRTSLTSVATSLCRQCGMSYYTMPKGVQRKMLRDGFPLIANAEFRMNPDTGRVGVFSTKILEVGHPMMITNSALADVFVLQRNLPVDYMQGHVLPTRGELLFYEDEEQEEEQPDPILPSSEEQPAVDLTPFNDPIRPRGVEAEVITTPTETVPQVAHMDSPMNSVCFVVTL